ncbi:thiopeptide-type bacteriocin biosynthesis protein [Mucilaginibacter rubeus]|uniref:lantibiotic dehydratase n=1 Tax=Mucilaginibacter rubeus TaxID=2027860 RepID=UPI0033957D81
MSFEQVGFLDKVFVREPYLAASVYGVHKLREVLPNNAFRNAVWLASPVFYNELDKKGFDFDRLSARERLTALKFYNRMSFRATPFGAFAAFGLANWDEGTKRNSVNDIKPVLHLMPSLAVELGVLEAKPLTDNVLVAVNPTLYKQGAGWRYSRYETDDKGKLSFFVYLLAYDRVDELLLAYLNKGPLPLADLLNYLTDLTDCTADEAQEHIENLIGEQVFATAHALSLLSEGAFAGQLSTNYDEDLRLPGWAFQNLSANDGKSVYAGLELRDCKGLQQHWQQEIMDALIALDRLASVPVKNNMDRFREGFEQKFGERSVPMLEALDPDLGVAFDEEPNAIEHELLKGLEFEQVQKKNNQLTWSAVHGLLMKAWLQNAKRDRWEPVILTPNDLSGLPGSDLPFPPSASVLCSVAGDKLVFQNIGGATANALLGRFSAFSTDFEDFCRSVAAAEQAANPEIMFAEILQVSHLKIDNINRRRRVYKYMIPLNCYPPKDAILPADLDVLVRGKELILVHRSTGKRVVPRLPTAFNYHHNDMALFRFLCALQFKSIRANFDFDPEKYFPGLNFYPRFEFRRTILSLARWYLKKEEIASLTRIPLSIGRLHLFCRDRGIPAKITAGKGDQQLTFDLSDDVEAIFFLESLKDQEEPVITEWIADATSGQAGIDGKHQFVVSLFNRGQVYTPAPVIREETSIIRDFVPGSEWVYLKVYGTPQSLQTLLTKTLFPWIDDNRQRIEQWFFIRYTDTGTHLRLRFRVDSALVKDLQYDLQALVNPLRITGLVQQAYFDTYQREIERYSSQLMGEVEEVFFRGSEYVAARFTGGIGEGDEAELLWPIVHCYQMIKVFLDNDQDAMIQLSEWAAQAFFREHGGDKKLKRSMDDRFRSLRPGLYATTAAGGGGEQRMLALNKSLRRLSRSAADSGFDRQKLLADIVHMHVNRIFTSGPRRHEAFIWHCILKMAISDTKRYAHVELSAMHGR